MTMIGISWKREQGPADPLLRKMLAERGLDKVPQWEKEDDVRMAASKYWTGLVKDRDGPVNPVQREITDPAHITEEIKAKAVELGADLAGCGALTPIMIDDGFEMPHRNVVSFIVEEQYTKVLDGSLAIERETYDVYMRVADISTKLAAFIRELGFPAWAHHNGSTQIQAIPTMYYCGFGELGRHGSLINPTHAANFRPGFVTTNLPLQYDSPLEFGVQDYCENCNICRNNCPGDAIATDHILTEGVKRWRIDMEKCYPFSRLHDAYCHICVDVCPYVFKENGDDDKRAIYKSYMKQRKEDGYRSPNRL
jgi:epoxyqueuosine reductase